MGTWGAGADDSRCRVFSRKAGDQNALISGRFDRVYETSHAGVKKVDKKETSVS